MSRLVINIPEVICFSHTLEVRIYDINHGQHLGHDRLISLLHEARSRFFQSLGYEELDIDGIGIVIADLQVVYLGEAFAGEQVKVDISLDSFASKSVAMYYHVSEVQSGRLIAKAKTGIVFFDYAERTAVLMPESFRVRFVH